MSRTKVYFASDFHLGIDVKYTSAERERQIVAWLEKIKLDAQKLYLVGDLFDFWFEYSSVVPQGYVRFLGKLAELSDLGVELHIFTGNHDMWMFDYLAQELQATIYREPIIHQLGEKHFFIGHGDGLGPGDSGYKILKKVFASKICQWLFARLHPNFGIGLANYLSRRSRSTTQVEQQYFGDEKEWLLIFCNDQIDLLDQQIDYFVFGHRHLPIDRQLKNGHSRYINLGEWMNFNSYAVFDGVDLKIEFFENPSGYVYPKDQ